MNALPDPELIAALGPCLVINKPGGLLTQGPPGIDSLELRIKNYIQLREEKQGKVYLGVPHRLDRPASGVMLFARNIRAARRLAEQFQQRTIEKKYWVVVEGNVAADRGEWIDHLRKLPDEAKSVICDPSEKGSQYAQLQYSVIARENNTSWLEIRLETGRTHQIRLQSSHRGHPVVGDCMYGSQYEFGPVTHDQRKRWIALHAREIKFNHPVDKERYAMTAPLWEHWRKLAFDFPFDDGRN